MGLGSIIGTGVFVSLGIAAEIAGPAVILAVVIGAGVALCNGLSSAQLAINHPVSGGTYEYGYRYLTPRLGFIAGWLFLWAKTASAATAALGFAGYWVHLVGWSTRWVIPIALMAVISLTLIVLGGIRRANWANTLIVTLTLLSLGYFISVSLPVAIEAGTSHFSPFFTSSPAAVLEASALMFVAYTGYGRVATLNEETRHPRQTIPRAMVFCLSLTLLLYVLVAIGVVGSGISDFNLNLTAAPLEIVVRRLTGTSGIVIAAGAMTAMLGVLLNLILGLSRVLLAMGRRSDMPSILARLNRQQTTPHLAVLAVGGAIGLLVLLGNVKTTWSFSAFNVLIYYAITNAAVLRLSSVEKLFPRSIAWIGLIACLILAFWVDLEIWLIGLGLIGIGLIGYQLRQRSR